jgi:uncharacterized protein (TIGR01777 family)
MKKTILITGGSGLIGKSLSQMAIENNFEVRWLGRTNKNIHNIKTFIWDIAKKYIDEQAFENVDYVIHLAGAGVADKSWTEARKKEIWESRTLSTALLIEHLEKTNIKKIIFGSAIGIYGMNKTDELLDEESTSGNDFLAEVTKAWEIEMNKTTIPHAKIRIGVVLSNQGGAWVKLIQPIQWGVGAGLGSGQQYVSWIHIKDLCRMFLFLIENENIIGNFNGVAPNPITNLTLTQEIAKKIKRPLFLPNVPSFVLKMMLGEMANIVLEGSNISSQKIQNQGFQFQFNTIQEAIDNLIKTKN